MAFNHAVVSARHIPPNSAPYTANSPCRFAQRQTHHGPLYHRDLLTAPHGSSVHSRSLDTPNTHTSCSKPPSNKVWSARTILPQSLPPSVPANANASPETSLRAPRAPGPAGPAPDGQVVVPEGEEGAGGADEVAKEDVESVVPEIGEPCRSYVDAGEPGDDGWGEEVQRWRCGLVADGC